MLILRRSWPARTPYGAGERRQTGERGIATGAAMFFTHAPFVPRVFLCVRSTDAPTEWVDSLFGGNGEHGFQLFSPVPGTSEARVWERSVHVALRTHARRGAPNVDRPAFFV